MGGDLALPEMAGVRCGDVVKGLVKPWACPKFGRECTPETPLGALMVSSEGACAAYQLYARLRVAGTAEIGAGNRERIFS
jgi:hydrogenase expression/formation protein HypD